MLTAVWNNPAASACALVGAICLISWPLCRTRRGMLLVQLGIGIGFGLHYALWGSVTAALVNGLGAVQIASLLLFETSRLRCLGYAFVPVVIGACAVTWHGLPSILAAIGQSFITLGRMQLSPSAMRVLALSGVLLWAAHDTIIRSPLVIADLLSLTMGAVAVLRPASDLRSGRSTGLV